MPFQKGTGICVNQSPTAYHIQLLIILIALALHVKNKNKISNK